MYIERENIYIYIYICQREQPARGRAPAPAGRVRVSGLGAEVGLSEYKLNIFVPFAE